MRKRSHVSGRMAIIPQRVIDRIEKMTLAGGLRVPRTRKPCDLWLGPVNGAGYPHVYWSEGGVDYHLTVGIAQYRLHRGDYVWSNEYVCHSCDVKTCVNPEHLFVGTAHMNAKDVARRGSSRDQGVLTAEVSRQLVERARRRLPIPLWFRRQAHQLGLPYGLLSNAALAPAIKECY